MKMIKEIVLGISLVMIIMLTFLFGFGGENDTVEEDSANIEENILYEDDYLKLKADEIYVIEDGSSVDGNARIELILENKSNEYIETQIKDFYVNGIQTELFLGEEEYAPVNQSNDWPIWIKKEVLTNNGIDTIENIKMSFTVYHGIGGNKNDYDVEVEIDKQQIEAVKPEEEVKEYEVVTQEDDDKFISEQETNIERENIIGTSNKKCSDIDIISPSDVRNDTTGNWKLARVATHEDILEYILDYYENNFNDDEEIHAIVNFTLKTTTKVSKLFDNVLAVTIHDYVDKEEHDAKKLFSGTVLGEYFIYLDNGDIEELKE